MRMVQSILFATDFLPATAEVAQAAVRLASVFESHLTLLHVIEPVPADPTGLRYHREQAAARLRELGEQLALDKVVVDESSIAVGSPADTIVRKAEEVDADLVLIGAGETARFDRPAGPTAEAVLQHARQPVLAIRPGDPPVRFQQILCPVDQSAYARRGLQNAVRLATAFRGRVVVLTVVPAVSWLSSAWDIRAMAGAAAEHERSWRADFDHFLDGIDFGNVAWQKEVRTGEAGHEIPAAARDRGADVIVMGSTGRTGLPRMLMGSVTRRVLRRLPCSLLAVKNEDVVEGLLEGDLRAINLLMAEGQEMLAAGCHAQAAGKFRQALLHNPFHVVALEKLAEAYHRLGRAEEAAGYQRRAKALSERGQGGDRDA
jgi:nucleotide-binding universal stress UspA family protein